MVMSCHCPRDIHTAQQHIKRVPPIAAGYVKIDPNLLIKNSGFGSFNK